MSFPPLTAVIQIIKSSPLLYQALLLGYRTKPGFVESVAPSADRLHVDSW